MNTKDTNNKNNPQNPYKSFLVRASAGSGKTYQLAHRFFYLVLSGADPKNIYTITFTKKAASEMKNRIYKISSDILYSSSLKSHIINDMKLFNPSLSFTESDIISTCKKILQTDSDLKISTIDSLFYEWVKLFPYESLLFDQDFFFDIAPDNQIEEFKQKAWTLLCESISLSIEKGSFQKEFPTTFLYIKKEGLLSLETKIDSLFQYELFIWEKLFHNKKVISSIESSTSDTSINYYNSLGEELFNLFKIYYSFFTQIKQENKVLTYSDITKGVYTLFNKQEFLSCRYLIHSQISHLLIDEFQDTNKIQWNIFKSISEEILSLKNTSSSNKNTLSTVFFVGDIKQSIYGFREADPTIMLEASSDLKKYGLNTISLDYNYRSSKNIIDYTNEVFTDLIPDFVPSSVFQKDQKDFIPNNSSITILPLIEDSYDTVKNLREKEAYAVASFIQSNISKLKKSDHTGSYPLEYKDIAILYRKSVDIEGYEKVFQTFSIPFKKESSDTFFSSIEIKDLLSLIKAIIFKNDINSFSELIKSKIINMDDNDFINFLVYNKEKKLNETSSNIHQIYLSDYILNKYPELNIILDYQTKFLLYSPYKLFLDLIYKLDIFNKYQQYFSDNYSSIYLNILKFIDLIYTLEQEGLYSLIDLYYSIEKKIDEKFSTFQNDENAVNFMTIHKSKGLEFPMVFLIDAASNWDKSNHTGAVWIKSHKNLDKELSLYYVGSKSEQNKIDGTNISEILSNASIYREEEFTRLLYVALTRTANHLIISGYKTDKSGVSIKYQKLISSYNEKYLSTKEQEQQENDNIDKKDVISSNISNNIDSDLYYDNDIEKLKTLSNTDLDNIIEIVPHSLVDQVFKNLKPIDSDVDNIDPLSLEHNINNLDSNQSSDLNYGTLVHKGMDFYIKKGFISEEILEELTPSFMEVSSIHKAFLEIETLINSSLFKDLTKDSILESEFRLCSLKNKALVKGCIDLLIHKKDSSDFIVIDYKTGNFDTIYYNQIKEYKNMVQDLYPSSTVKSYILKTKTLELIEII